MRSQLGTGLVIGQTALFKYEKMSEVKSAEVSEVLAPKSSQYWQ